jgi:hypothetical protein
MSFQSVQGGVGYNDTAGDADSRRRQQLAQLMLRQGEAAPAVGVTGALNKILSGAIAGWQMGKDSEEQKARGDAKQATLAEALRAGQGQAAETKSYGDGTTINWDGRKGDQGRMAEILAGNRDTAPMGMQMQVGQMEEQRKAETAAAAALLEHNRAIERDRMKPLDITDKQYFVPDMPGQAPAPAQTAPPAPAPQAGPGPSTAPVAATSPPTPLAPTSGSGRMEPKSNNPGNIRTSAENDWQGKNTPQGARFEAFDTPENGIRAMGVLLGSYAKQGTNTLRGIVGKWAPPNENQTDALTVNAARRTGLDLDQPLDLNDPAIRSKVVNALIQQEQGGMPYSPEQVRAGVDASLNRTAQPPAAPPQVQAAVAPPANQGPQRTVMGGQSGTVVGGQGGPKFRPATPDDLSRNGLPPGTAAQVDRNGQVHVLQKAGEGGGGLFGGPGENPATRNLYIKLQTKVASGESLTPQEQLAMAMIQQDAEKPRMMTTDKGVVNIPGMPLPTMPGRQAPAAAQTAAPPPVQAAPTDTVPNPMAPPAPAPAPAPAPRPQPTVIIPRADKAIPEKVNNGMLENVNAIRKIDDALAAIAKTPDATGGGVGIVNHMLPDAATNFLFPEGTNARALISEISSMKIHDRAGASQTAGEMENLKPFIPKMSDTPADIKTKIAAFRREYINMLNDTNAAYGADAGYQVNPIVAETLKTGRAPRYEAPVSGEDPNKPKSTLSGVSDADILKSLGM